jgi:2,3-bisphosphoglycerate-dependent phosphoglycerate mutase
VTTDLYLIRHGEAQAALRDFIGDTSLSPLGVTQAEHLRDRLVATHEIQADVFIASTLLRAHETASIIAPAFDVPLILDDEIQEIRPGDAAGMTVAECNQKFGWVDFRETPLKPMAPGGENWGQFLLRVATALERIIRQYDGKTIVLVCHGGVIDGTFLNFFKVSSLSYPPSGFRTRNTSITHWQKKDEAHRRWRLMRYNDAFHLYDIGTPVRIPWEQIRQSPASDMDRPTIPLPTEDADER